MTTSIFQKFFIQFEGDASHLKKGVSETEKQTEKLEASLTSADLLARKVGHSFKEAVLSLGTGFLAALSVERMGEGVLAASEYADQIGKLSESVGLNVEDLAAWSHAVKVSGGSAEEFEGTVERMSAQLADFATKGHSRSAPFFKELGIKMTDAKGKARSFIAILPELADKFQGLGKGEAFGIGERLGLDRGTILLLQQGRADVEKLIKRQKELGVPTEEDAKIAADFNDRWEETKIVLEKLALKIGELVLPVLTGFSNSIIAINGFVKEHAGLVSGVLSVALLGFAAVVTARLIPAIKNLSLAFIRLDLAAFPITALIALIVAIVLVLGLFIEDIYYFATGQNSLLGKLIEKYPTLGKIIHIIAETFKTLWGVIDRVFSLFAEALNFLILLFVNPKQAFHNLMATIMKGWSWFESKFPQTAKTIEHVFTAIANVIKAVWQGILNVVNFVIDGILAGVQGVEKAYNKIKSFIKGDNKINVEQIKVGLAKSEAYPFGGFSKSLANSMSVAKHTNVNVGKVEVNTQATDAKAISQQIGDTLHAQMRKAVNQFDDGVAA